MGAESLALSPDGQNMYIGGTDTIAEFARNADGSLTQLGGANNCIEEHGGHRLRDRDGHRGQEHRVAGRQS